MDWNYGIAMLDVGCKNIRALPLLTAKLTEYYFRLPVHSRLQ
jgi:hypothetical protein